MWVPVQCVVCLLFDLSSAVCYVLITRFMFLLFVLCVFCFLFCVFCVFVLFCVFFLLMCVVVSFLFVYKFSDHCYWVKIQFELINSISYYVIILHFLVSGHQKNV